jgi:hypothetical protein
VHFEGASDVRKRFYKITRPRLLALGNKWAPTLNRFRGPIPVGLGIAHMIATTNGDEDPTLRDAQLRPVGLMQIPYREGRRLRYVEKDLKDSTINLYVWCLLANNHAEWLHENYARWTMPNIDFWQGVRLVFIVGRTNFANLYTAAKNAGYYAEDSNFAPTAGIMEWIQTQQTLTQQFNGLSRADLRRIVDHLGEVRTAIQMLDGLNWISARFSEGPTVAPGNEFSRHKTVAAAETA